MSHLAVELDPARGEGRFDADHWVRLARQAERAGLDFIALPDSFAGGQLDAVAIAARVAPATSAIGLVPTVTATHTEPFHLSKAIATLDFVSLGRAGWAPDVSRTRAEADLFGRKEAAPVDVLWRELAEAVEVVVRLWDSWEDDAVIRDAATARYVDRDKLHYLDFTGEFFSVKGPSITPRSPQAHPLVVLRADEPEALPVVGRWADVVRISTPEPASAVRDAVAAAGRSPDSVAVLLDQPPGTAAEVLEAGAVDGVTLLARPGDLDFIADELVPALVERGLRAPGTSGGTLRERFGLARPANHFTEVRA